MQNNDQRRLLKMSFWLSRLHLTNPFVKGKDSKHRQSATVTCYTQWDCVSLWRLLMHHGPRPHTQRKAYIFWRVFNKRVGKKMNHIHYRTNLNVPMYVKAIESGFLVLLEKRDGIFNNSSAVSRLVGSVLMLSGTYEGLKRWVFWAKGCSFFSRSKAEPREVGSSFVLFSLIQI